MKTLLGMFCIASSAIALASCGDSGDSTTVDGGTAIDSSTTVDATTTVDAAAAAASATWTLMPNPVCTTVAIAKPLCLDQGASGGYQLAAVAACPLNNAMTIFTPGGGPPAAGTYTVKPVGAFADALNLTAGQVVVRAVFHPDINTQEEWWAQTGTVTVTTVGGKPNYSGPTLTAKKFVGATTVALAVMANCP
jgi:hypothetical protein